MIYKNKSVQKYVGEMCREFRMSVLGMTLHQVVGYDHVKALSAFEMGRSSNMLLLLEYAALAIEKGESELFNNMLQVAIEMGLEEGYELESITE